MSKRHQASRRKTYGRRQHELHERHDRRHRPGDARSSTADGRGASGQSIRSPSTTRARACASLRRRVTWPSTRAPAHGSIASSASSRPGCRGAERSAARAGCRGAVRARRRAEPPSGLALGAIVVVFLLAFFSLAPGRPRLRHGLRHRPPAARARAAASPRPGPSFRPQSARPASRRSASWRIDAGLGQLGEPARPAGPLSERIARMLGRTDSRRRLLLLLVVFVVGSLALVARLALLAGRRSGDSCSLEAAAQTTDHASRRRAGAATSTTAAARSCSRRPSTATAWSRRRPSYVAGATASAPSAQLIRLLELDEAAAATCTTKLASGKAVRRPRPRPRRRATSERDPRGRRAADGSSTSRSSRSRCGSIRRTAAARTRTLAAHLLGFVNREGTGQYGVEQYYQDALAGTPRIVSRAARRQRAADARDRRSSSSRACPARTCG